MNIQLPEKLAKYLSAPNYVNDCLNYYFRNTYKDIKPAVESRLLGLQTEWDNASKYPEVFERFYGDGDVVNTTSKFRSFLRLAGGYNVLFGTFTAKNTRFELFTNDAYILKINKKIGKKLTADHIFGTTEIGVQMFIEYESSGWDIKHMIEEYIPQTLYQSSLCRMLKTEHQKEDDDDTNGVARGKHSLQEKISLNHYKEVGISLPLQVYRLGII
tara:strand:+ start:135 stop:779 length:645 start_codon:yes stop_codon:yes gene_type:complete